jgi:hypothetical protein
MFQYQDASIGGGRDYGAEATVGIQGDKATGLEYSYNTPALSDGLAICFAYPGEPTNCLPFADIPWLSEEPYAGTIGTDSTRAVTVTLNALPSMDTGVFTATLEIRTEDAVKPQLNVPVTLMVPESWRLYLPVTLRGFSSAE